MTLVGTTRSRSHLVVLKQENEPSPEFNFHDLTRFNKIAIQATAQMAVDKEALAYRKSTCTNLSVSSSYEIIVYSVLKHAHTIS